MRRWQVAFVLVMVLGLVGLAPAQGIVCASSGSSQSFEWMYRLRIGTAPGTGGAIDVGSGTRRGYVDGTAQSLTSVEAGATLHYELGLNSTAGYTENVQIWLDLNGDGSLQAAERVVSRSVFVNGVTMLLGSFVVPGTSAVGTTTLGSVYGRAIMSFGSASACGSYTYGTTIDFRIEVQHAAADHLVTIAPAGPQTAGEPFELVEIRAVDRFGNLADGANGASAYTGEAALSYTLSGERDGPSAGIDAFPTNVTFSAGVASASLTTTLHRAQLTTITARDDALPRVQSDVPSSPFEVVAADAAQLRFSSMPSQPSVAEVLTPAPSVRVEDAFGNAATSSQAPVLFEAIDSADGLRSAGPPSVTPVAGVATLACAWFDAPVRDVRLRASSAGLASVDSDPFDVAGALVRGTVYLDPDASGVRSADATGIEGAQISLERAGQPLSWPDGGDLDAAGSCVQRSVTSVQSDALGRYAIAGLEAGDVELVVTGSTLSGLAPVSPQPSTLRVPAFGQLLDADVGFFPGALVRGVLFRDDGRAGAANDARRAEEERPVSGARVQAVPIGAGASARVESATDADGRFRIALPTAALPSGASIAVTHALERATGFDRDGEVSYAAGGAGDLALFGLEPGDVVSLAFGIVARTTLVGEGSATVLSPGTRRFDLLLTPGTEGVVELAASSGRYAWSAGLAPDAGCADVPAMSGTAWLVDERWPRQANGALAPCRVAVDVHAPAGEPVGRVEALQLRAHLQWDRPVGAPPVMDTSPALTLRTIVSDGSRLSLTMQARSQDGDFGERLEVTPTSVVTYRVRFANVGGAALRELVVSVPIDPSLRWEGGSALLSCPGGSDSVEVELDEHPDDHVLSLDVGAATACGVSQLEPGDAGELQFDLRVR